MLSTSQVAELVGVTPARIRQQAKAREAQSAEARRSLSLVEYLQIIPAPAGQVGTSYGYDEFEVLRWRAYREGGKLARRAELAMLDAGDPFVEATLLSVLNYPPTDLGFREWLVRLLEREVTA